MEDKQHLKSPSEEAEGNIAHFADVAAIGAHYSKLKSRHRKRVGKKHGLGNFERRYSKLASEKILIPERKRIDFVLIYPNVNSTDATDPDKIQQLLRHEKYRARFTQMIKKEGFFIQTDTVGENVYVELHCPFKRLCVEAERVHVEMPLKDMEIPDRKPMNFIQKIVDKYLDTDKDVSDFVSCPFNINKIHLFEGHEDPTYFFRPALRSLLVYHILINIDIRNAQEVMEDGADSDEENVNTSCFCCPSICRTICSCCTASNALPFNAQSKTSLKRKGLPYLLMKDTYTYSMVLHDESALSRHKEEKLSNHFVSSDTSLLHLGKDPRKELDETWTKFLKFQPLWKIRNYFGEKIGMYFAWTGMLISTLWVPSIFGICIFFYGLAGSVSKNQNVSNVTSVTGTVKDALSDVKQAFDNDVTPYFALFICCWGTVFLELWKRQRATLAYEWDVNHFEANEPDRPQFYGTKVKVDPVTQEDSWFYPFRLQLLKYSTSASVLICMTATVVISVFAVIMYRVIMDVDYCPDLPDSRCFILTTVVSSVLNAISILLLGKLYDALAVILTDWENHRTQTRYDDALIMKLFAFQFVNSYSSCFYIAFLRGRSSFFEDRYVDSCVGSCMTQLSFQVLILMLMKPFPKLIKDIILPLLVKVWASRPACCHFRCCRKNKVQENDLNMNQDDAHKSHLEFLERERRKPDLGDFTLGEYTEKVIVYGFLMLFAASFPLAPLLALIISYVDIRVDAKRLLWLYKRPIAFIAQDIGMWKDILNLVNLIGVMTNAFILAFTSSWGKQFDIAGKLAVVIIFEHIVFTLKYFLAYLIPDVPQPVRLAIRREKYLIQNKLDEDSSITNVDYSSLYPPVVEMMAEMYHGEYKDEEVNANRGQQTASLGSPPTMSNPEHSTSQDNQSDGEYCLEYTHRLPKKQTDETKC